MKVQRVLWKRVLSFTLGAAWALSWQVPQVSAEQAPWMEVSCRVHYARETVGFDIQARIFEGGRWVATVTDDFLNGQGRLADHGPQPGFASPAEAHRYWEGKDAVEVLEGGIFVLLDSIQEARRRRAWFEKVKALYESLYRQAASSGICETVNTGMKPLFVFLNEKETR